MKLLAGLIGGFVLAVLGVLLVTITLAATPEKVALWGATGFFLLWTLGFVIALMATSAAKAWRRLLLTSAIFSFLLPLTGVIYTGSFMATHVDKGAQYAGAQAAGAAIGGGLVTGVLGFIGFFLGLVLLIIGLLVGRDKQVIYVQTPPSDAPPTRP